MRSPGATRTATVDAIKRFQKATPPLSADGLAGPRTLAALDIWSGITRQNVFAPGQAPAGPWPAPIFELPKFALTAEGIPHYSGRGICSRADADMIAFQFGLDGADIATQQWAVYVASREGGCRYQTINYNLATADDSHCTFQLNVLSKTFEPWVNSVGAVGPPTWCSASLEMCANAASDLWVYCGRGPWEPPYYCTPPWKSATPLSTVPTLPGDFGATTSSIVAETSTTVAALETVAATSTTIASVERLIPSTAMIAVLRSCVVNVAETMSS